MTQPSIASPSIVADPAALAAIVRALLNERDAAGQWRVCPTRLLAAAALIETVERTARGQWLVPSSTGQDAYLVDPTGQVCSCPDHQQRGVYCKHALAVAVFRRLEQREAEAGCPADPDADADAPIPFALTSRARAALDPTAPCAGCDDTAADHDGPEGQCTRRGADAEGWWQCDCEGFQTDDDEGAA
jgi:ferredoxin-thioredoxin reductase catalytic subunit